MKKINFCILPLTIFLVSTVFADPTSLIVNITCPSATGTTNVLSNYGDHIRGPGKLTLSTYANSESIYFNYDVPSTATIPHKLTNYKNSGTDYDPVTAVVYCSFASSVTGESPFTTTYKAENFKGGIIDTASQTVSSLKIFTSFGIKK